MPVVGRLDQYGSMIVSGEFNEVGYSTVSIGESSFTSPGTFSWTVPTDVTSISVVTVGGGGGGALGNSGGAGGGGALAYANHISVTPGETLTVGVGTSGIGATSSSGIGSIAFDGGNSYLKRSATSLVEAGGGKKGNNIFIDGNGLGGAGGTVIVGTGGSGGKGGDYDSADGMGGGGAGGYSGSGGVGANPDVAAGAGSGGGGGGGSTSIFPGAGGGGVGINGEGPSGLGGVSSGGGGGGSGGENGENRPSQTRGGNGGKYGGGGATGDSGSDISGFGASGAVRIIWGLGAHRQFPATRTGVLTETYAKAGVSGLGTYTALEFKENIGITTTLRANVFAPYDPIYDEFAGVLFGPGQGTFMRQELNGNVIVYNEINEIGLSESYTITPQSLSINEGDTVIFTINATNVPDGTEIFYEII